MNSEIKKVERDFLNLVKKISAYNEALALIYWDLRTGAPKKGVDQRSEVIGKLSSEVFEMSVKSKNEILYCNTIQHKRTNFITEITKKTVEDCKKDYDRNKKIPQHEHKEFIILHQSLKVHGRKGKV